MSTRGHTITPLLTLVTEECCNCGITFAMPDAFKQQCLDHSKAAPGRTKSFYCPNGHEQFYTGTNAQQEAERRAEREAERRARAVAERDQAKATATAQKAAATRARNERDRSKKRAAAALCPCCNRSFKQLRRHMKAKHPDYQPVEEPAAS